MLPNNPYNWTNDAIKNGTTQSSNNANNNISFTKFELDNAYENEFVNYSVNYGNTLLDNTPLIADNAENNKIKFVTNTNILAVAGNVNANLSSPVAVCGNGNIYKYYKNFNTWGWWYIKNIPNAIDVDLSCRWLADFDFYPVDDAIGILTSDGDVYYARDGSVESATKIGTVLGGIAITVENADSTTTKIAVLTQGGSVYESINGGSFTLINTLKGLVDISYQLTTALVGIDKNGKIYAIGGTIYDTGYSVANANKICKSASSLSDMYISTTENKVYVFSGSTLTLSYTSPYNIKNIGANVSEPLAIDYTGNIRQGTTFSQQIASSGVINPILLTFPNHKTYCVSSIADITGLPTSGTYNYTVIIKESDLTPTGQSATVNGVTFPTYSAIATAINTTTYKITEQYGNPTSYDSTNGTYTLDISTDYPTPKLYKGASETIVQFVKAVEFDIISGVIQTPSTYSYNGLWISAKQINVPSTTNTLYTFKHNLGTSLYSSRLIIINKITEYGYPVGSITVPTLLYSSAAPYFACVMPLTNNNTGSGFNKNYITLRTGTYATTPFNMQSQSNGDLVGVTPANWDWYIIVERGF